ncbi:unnamed protein product [Peniophora sp. CBMAI 1063]|nr:unnamed protein product [Peniophora sp. CBMAI 1063]
MNPFDQNPGQNGQPMQRPRELYLRDLKARLILTRDGGGTVIPDNGDMPHHVDQTRVDEYINHLEALAASGRQAMEALNQLQSVLPANHRLSRLALPAPPTGPASPGPAAMAGSSHHAMGGYATQQPAISSPAFPQSQQGNAPARMNASHTIWAGFQQAGMSNTTSTVQNTSQYTYPYSGHSTVQSSGAASYQSLAASYPYGPGVRHHTQQQQRPTMNASTSGYTHKPQNPGQLNAQPMTSPDTTVDPQSRPSSGASAQTGQQSGNPASGSSVQGAVNGAPSQPSVSTSSIQPSTGTHSGHSNDGAQDFGLTITKEREPSASELHLDLSYLSRKYGPATAKRIILFKLESAGHHKLVHKLTAATPLSGLPAGLSTTSAPASAAKPSAPAQMPSPVTSQTILTAPAMSAQHNALPPLQPFPSVGVSSTSTVVTPPASSLTATATATSSSAPSASMEPTLATAMAEMEASTDPAIAGFAPTEQSHSHQPSTHDSHSRQREQRKMEDLQSSASKPISGVSTTLSAAAPQTAQYSSEPAPNHPPSASILRDSSGSVLSQQPNRKTLARDILRSLSSPYPARHSQTVRISHNAPSTSARNSAPRTPIRSILPQTDTDSHMSLPTPGPVPQGATVISPGIALLHHDSTAASMPQDAQEKANRTDIGMQDISTGPSSPRSLQAGDQAEKPVSNSGEPSTDRQSSNPPSGPIFMDLITPDPSPPLSTHPLEDPDATLRPASHRDLRNATSYATGASGPEAAFGYISPRSSPPLAAHITEVEEEEEVQDVSASGVVEDVTNISTVERDVDMDAGPAGHSSAMLRGTSAASFNPRKRNRAYVDLPPLPAHLRPAHQRMLKKARLDEAASEERAAAEKARQEERSEITAMATQVLGEFPCEWEGCDALLISLRTRFKHFKQHLEIEAEFALEEVICRWDRCSAEVEPSRVMQHLTLHAPHVLLCPYEGCGLELESSALVEHVKGEHDNTQGRLPDCLPSTPSLGPPPERLSNGVYFPRVAQPAVMSQEYRQELGPWVLRQIHSTSSYAPTRKGRSHAPEPPQEDVWDFMDEVEVHDNGGSAQISVDLDDLDESSHITRILQEGGQVRVYAEDEYDSVSDDEGSQSAKLEHDADGCKSSSEGVQHSVRGSGDEDDPLDLISAGSRDSEEGDMEIVDNLLG